MAKKRARLMNPDDVRVLGRDVDDVVLGSESTIDTLYDQYFQEQRDLNTFEDIKYNLERNDQTIPNELKANIRKTKERIRELDRRIVHYGNLMLRRIRDRLDVARRSPGASINQPRIKRIERGLFQLEKKLKEKGVDLRRDISRLMGELVTLEQDSGIVLMPPSPPPTSAPSRRRENEAELYAGLAEEWRRVFRHAKNDPRVQEDVEWVNAQLRSLNDRFARGESIRLGMERVARRIRDIHNRTKPRAKLQDFEMASQGVRDFASRIRDYSQSETVTPAGIDRLQFELEQFSRQFSPQTKAEWTKDEQRKFGGAVRKLRKALDNLRPGRRKNNPCVGLHFHGKDADEILEALEKSSKRMMGDGAGIKRNPKKRAKKKAAKSLSRDNPGDGGAVIPMRIPIPAGYSKYFTYPAGGPDSDGLHTYRWRGRPVSRLRIWRGVPGEDSFPWNGIIYVRGEEVHNIFAHDRDSAFSEAVKVLTSLAPAKNQNPKKRASKKKASKKSATPEWKRLISRCQKLWNQYLDRPSKKALKDVFAHLEKMEKSASERVKKERARCLRVANQEAKRLGI